MSEQDLSRLSRIEDKLDNLSEAISKLAVVDARLTDFISSNSRTSARLSEIEKLFNALTNRVVSLEVKSLLLTKVLWLVGSTTAIAIVGAILKVVLNG